MEPPPPEGAEGAKVVDLMPWDITMRSAAQRRRVHDLIERKDADEAIRGLGELEAYYAVKALGVEDAAPLLAVSSPDQIQALIDLDIWQGERPSLSDLVVWLAAFEEIS